MSESGVGLFFGRFCGLALGLGVFFWDVFFGDSNAAEAVAEFVVFPGLCRLTTGLDTGSGSLPALSSFCLRLH